MTQTNGLAVRADTSIVASVWNREQIDTIKSVLVPGATDTDLMLLAQVSQRTGLDLFTRQMYGIMRVSNEKDDQGNWHKVKKLSIQISIDGFRLIAVRTAEYAGQEGPFWCDSEGNWTDVWLSKDNPSAAKVGVWRKGFVKPVWGVAVFDSYAATIVKDGKTILTGLWSKMPDVLIAKCAEALALRKAFPQELSGLYSTDEMGQADNNAVSVPVDAAPVLEAALADGVTPAMLDDYRALYNRGGALGLDMKPYLVDKSVARNRLAQLGKQLSEAINAHIDRMEEAVKLPAAENAPTEDVVDAADLAMIRAQRGGN